MRNCIGHRINAQNPRRSLRYGINLAINWTDGAAVVLPLHPDDRWLVLLGVGNGGDGEGGHLVGVGIDLQYGVRVARQPVDHAVVRRLDAPEPLVMSRELGTDETELVVGWVEDEDLGEVARDEVQMSSLAGAFPPEELVLAMDEGRLDERNFWSRGDLRGAHRLRQIQAWGASELPPAADINSLPILCLSNAQKNERTRSLARALERVIGYRTMARRFFYASHFYFQQR